MAHRPARSTQIELDLDRYELRRAGVRVKLERIPMELLILLAASEGKLVTREEIVARLWGDTAFDADRSLNTGIGKLRRALGDDADHPQYVETVVGKGYRLIAPVQHLEPGSTTGIPAANGKAGIVLWRSAPKTAADPPVKPGKSIRSGWLKLIAAGAVGIAGAMVWVNLAAKPAIELLGYDRITRDGRRKSSRIGDLPLPVLTDGSRIYFSQSGAGGTFEVSQVSAAGGEAGSFPTLLPSPVALDVSADGSRLLMGSPASLPEGPLWTQSVPDGSPAPLGDVRGSSGSWSPDGTRIVVARRDGLYVAGKDGAGAHAIVHSDPAMGEQIYWPRWSPDGARLRYSLYAPKTGFHQLWEVGVDGRNLRQVLPGWDAPPHHCCGSWTRDGRYFVFAAVRDGHSDIWAMREGGGLLRWGEGQPQRITAGPLAFFAPAPSPDGRLFVFGTEQRCEVVRCDPRSQKPEPWLAGISATGVSFSADGVWAAYTSFPDHSLWRSKTDGSDRLQLTSLPMAAYLPRWSPDGSQIAFYGRMPGRPRQIYLVGASGGAPRLLRAEENHQIDPGWSPDGSRVVFERSTWQERGANRATGIAVMDLKSRQVTPLPGSTRMVSPRWSPDGKYIAAMPADSSGLRVFDLSAGSWSELLRFNIGYPNWSHDSKYIYFDRFAKPAGVGRVRVRDHSIETVLAPERGDQLWSIDTWTGVTPDDAVLLVRDASLEEIYALRWREH